MSTGRVVNLRAARKRKARASKRAEAEANALAHGRPKVERERDRAVSELEARRLEGHRREHGDDD